jgi:biotin operon repressor
LKANHQPKRWQGVEVLSGQFITSYASLSAELPMSIQQIRTAINKLKSTGEITIKTTSKYSIISITNWDDYQGINKQNNKQVTSNQQTSNKQVTTNNNENNENNDNKTPPPEINQAAWNDYLDHRKAVRAGKLKPKSVEKLFKWLIEQGGHETQAKVIDQSIRNGWKGLFELKEVNNNGTHKQTSKPSLAERLEENRKRAERQDNEQPMGKAGLYLRP